MSKTPAVEPQAETSRNWGQVLYWCYQNQALDISKTPAAFVHTDKYNIGGPKISRMISCMEPAWPPGLTQPDRRSLQIGFAAHCAWCRLGYRGSHCMTDSPDLLVESQAESSRIQRRMQIMSVPWSIHSKTYEGKLRQLWSTLGHPFGPLWV